MKIYLLLLISILTTLFCQVESDKNEIQPKRSDIIESVYASVTVKPETSYFPQPTRSGTIEKIYIEEGDLVEEEEVLFRISPSVNDKIQLSDAQINLKEAKSNFLGSNNLLNNIQLELQATRKQLMQDSINFRRQERLTKKNIGKKIDYDQSRLKFQLSKNQLQMLEQKYIQLELSLKNNYEKALNRVETESKELTDFVIRSKMDGKAYSIHKEEGDFISVQEKFSEIGSSETFKIEMDIDEVDITKVELGDSVLIVLDAYEEQVFVAIVSKIATMKNNITQTFRVESVFLQVPPKLYYGLSGEANIMVSRRKNAIIIPTEYLVDRNKVLTTNGEKKIEIGVRNLEYVEIISGIDTTTNLIKPNE